MFFLKIYKSDRYLSDRQDSCQIKNVYVSVVMIYDIEVNDGPKGEACVSDGYFLSLSITL